MTRRNARQVPAAPVQGKKTGLNPPAQAKFDECVERFKQNLLSEAEHLEAAQNAVGQQPEITATMIVDADIIVRRNVRKPKRSVVVTCAQLVTAGALVVVGVATNHLDKQWGQITFAISVTVAMVSILIAIVKEGK
jgi:hypothetical protein